MINVYQVKGEETIIFLLLKDGKTEIEAFIDTKDLDRVSRIRFAWGFTQRGYVLAKHDGETVSLHRWILGQPKGMVIDHVNGNPLDNRRSNLKIVTIQENVQNRVKLNKNNTSGYRGVVWAKDKRKWAAQVTINRKSKRLGLFDNKEDAAKAAAEARAKYMPNSKEARERGEYKQLG